MSTNNNNERDGQNENPYTDKTISTRKTQNETAVLPQNLNRRKSHPSSDSASTISDEREVILVIRGMIERVVISENMEFFLGRFEPTNRQPNQVDLTPYGAMDRGVSRVHARVHLEDSQLYITDLGSTNGTTLAGTRLEPETPTLLRKGDELLIGRLAVQVMFR